MHDSPRPDSAAEPDGRPRRGAIAAFPRVRGRRSDPPAVPDLEALRARILITVRRVCPRWMAADVEDVAQNALVKVCQILDRDSDRNRSFPASYMWKVAFTATVDAIRTRRRGGLKEVPMDETAERRPSPDSGIDPERRTRGREIARAILECLARLVAPRRLAATLYLHGHSVPEIGRLLRWSGAKANNLVHRGIADLRRCLAAKGLQP